MPFLEIRRPTNKREVRELLRQAPLLVGALDSNDIIVNDAGVAPVHCRISWKKRNFEVAAATPAGVEWNGAVVQQAMLSPGDVIRVGNAEIGILADDVGEQESRAAPPSAYDLHADAALGTDRPADSLDELELKPSTTDSLPVRSFYMSSEIPPKADPHPAPPRKSSPGPEAPASDRGTGMKRVIAPPMELILPDDKNDSADPPVVLRRGGGGERERVPATAILKDKLKFAQRRPGDQDVLRSPVVIGLGTGTLVLALTAATIWFVLSREAAQRDFDAARVHMESGQFTQAIEGFERFIKERPNHHLAETARTLITRSKVEQPLAGAAPLWEAGLTALDDLITEYRDTEGFRNSESELRQFIVRTADRIASGAAEGARSGLKTSLLDTSASAAKILELYSPPSSPPTDRLQEIARTVRAAQSAILERETFDGVVKKIDEALAAEKPLAALPEYRRLLDRYPNASEYRPLADRLKKVLLLEKAQSTRDESQREAIREERALPFPAPPLTLARRIRTRSDVPSVGSSVFAFAEDCLYGLDAATGEPLWRRVIGLDTPFYPQGVAAGVPAILAYDTRYRDLILVELRSGKLLWRLGLESAPKGVPLVLEGQVLVATSGGTLEQIDLQSGANTSRLKFSQGIVGPPAVSLSGERLYVPGHADVLYVLSRRPLACEQVTWLGQGPGAIEAPALMMRSYLLLAENDRSDRARLRVFDTTAEDQPLRPIAQQRIDGHVRDAPTIRGKQLVVPTVPERVAAFTVAETGNEQSLAFVASYQVKNAGGSPIFVALGPDDQLWMVSSALRRLTISRDSLLPDKQELAIGIASQPLQMAGNALYVGRRVPYSRGVLLSEADRSRMTTQWQASLGARVLSHTTPAPDGAALCVTSLGELYQISANRISSGGFESQSLAQIQVPEGAIDELKATRMSDGRLAVSCGGSEPRLWITGNDALVRESRLSHSLEAAPISFGPGILLPLTGRLRLVGKNGDAPIAEDLPAPVSDSESAPWRSVAALDETQALALNARGRLTRLQFRTSPVAHLAEITDWQAEQPVDRALGVARGRVLIVDTAGRLVCLDASSFEPQGEFRLDQPASQDPWPVDDQVLIEVAGTKLVCFDLNQRLARQWELPLNGATVLGPPIRHNGKLVVALTDGRLLLVDPQSGEVSHTVDLEQRLGFGPEVWSSQVVVGTLDGSLLVIDPLLGPRP